LYFAEFKVRAGMDCEPLTVANGTTLAALYQLLANKHGLPLDAQRIRPAMNAQFCQWADVLTHQAEVVFIQPVSGG
jgi:molybdopterin converting factor small subunit